MDSKIKALIFQKDDMTPKEFLEVYKRIQAEDHVKQDDRPYDEHDICALISKLCIEAPDGLDKAFYIIKRTHELWVHIMRIKQSEIERIQADIVVKSS